MMTFKGQVFDSITDLYLPIDNPRNGFSYPDRLPLKPEMYEGAIYLAEMAKKKRQSDCTLSFEGVSFRCHYMPTAMGDFYIFRKMPSTILSMRELGLPVVVANHLVSPRLLKGGLIIVSGLPGNGKSTTLASIIVERLKKFAGICITVEDPIEMPLQGNHGNGMCLQRGVLGEEAFSGAIRDALRAYPAKTAAMMMIGEVRDAETAALALRSSVDGRLVMVTMHAGNIVQSIQRLCSMASKIISLEEVRELLASSFRLALHQNLVQAPNGKNHLKVSVLLDTLQAAGTIRQRNVSLDSLKNDIMMQQNCLKLNIPVELRPID
ncbi:ATPase, T2SS/T4P/T4SS family (plasmid) [Pseudomonas sp. FeN3W]|nr:ATPase, T2SS/T4P/T4SS family [Pseudomonas sp. FeN3W]